MNKSLCCPLFERLLMRSVCSIVILLVYSSLVQADVWDKWQSHQQEYQENEGVEDYVWKEGKSLLPDYPQDDDLVEVAGPANYQNYHYLIDIEHLTIGADGVVHYSMVIRSKAGVDNAFHEGLRCTSRQIKQYAYGSQDSSGKKRFSVNSNANWRPFRSVGVSGYAPILAEYYFCDFDSSPLAHHQIIHNIKYGKGKTDGFYD